MGGGDEIDPVAMLAKPTTNTPAAAASTWLLENMVE
jgi:hypothetical protein